MLDIPLLRRSLATFVGKTHLGGVFSLPFFNPHKGESHAISYNPSFNEADRQYFVPSWLRLINLSPSPQEVTIHYGEDVENLLIPAYGRQDSLIPATASKEDTYGAFTLELPAAGTISGTVARVRGAGAVGEDFITVMPVR